MQVAVTGATGFVGRRLVARLAADGHEPVALTRSEARAREVLGAEVRIRAVDPLDAAAVAGAIAGADGVVNLQGANLFGRRWNDAVKAELRASRVGTTETLVRAFDTLQGDAPRVLVSASAIGYYGPRANDQALDETAPPGDDFLARLCVAWEGAARGAEALGVRVVTPRLGTVLGRGGGALQAMEGPFRAFVGGPVGSGRQMVSWIHREDLVRLIAFLLTHGELDGAVNATAPQPVANRAFAKALGRALHRPSWAPAPAFVLRLALGEVAALVTTGQDVRPRRALAAGFTFRYPTIDEALAAVYAEVPADV